MDLNTIYIILAFLVGKANKEYSKYTEVQDPMVAPLWFGVRM
jgi:hypothetical protein